MRLSANRFVGLTLVGFGRSGAQRVRRGRKLTAADRRQPTAPPVATPTPPPAVGPRALRELRQAARGQRDGVVQDRRAGLPGRRGRGHPHAAAGAAADLRRRPGAAAPAPTTSGSSRSSTARGSVPPPRAKSWPSRASASYNEQYDVLSAKGGARFGPASYRVTCSPSARSDCPTPGLPPQQAGLPAGAEPRDRVRPGARGQVLRRRRGGHHADPEGEAGAVRLRRHRRPGPTSSAIRDLDGYNKGMVDIHDRQGLLRDARRRGAGVKKGSNTSSEQYDVDHRGDSTSGAAPASTASAATRPRSDDAAGRSLPRQERAGRGPAGMAASSPPGCETRGLLLLVDGLEHAGRVEAHAVAPVEGQEARRRASARWPAPRRGSVVRKKR